MSLIGTAVLSTSKLKYSFLFIYLFICLCYVMISWVHHCIYFFSLFTTVPTLIPTETTPAPTTPGISVDFTLNSLRKIIFSQKLMFLKV